MRWLSLVCLSFVCGAQQWEVNVVGKARGAPDVYYLLMKMENAAGRSTDAIAGGEKNLKQFLTAVEGLRIAGLSWRVTNNVLTPSQFGSGAVYTRNIVFTLAGEVSAEQRDAAFARLQDLGAKHNSHCVTCIGSG